MPACQHVRGAVHPPPPSPPAASGEAAEDPGHEFSGNPDKNREVAGGPRVINVGIGGPGERTEGLCTYCILRQLHGQAE